MRVKNNSKITRACAAAFALAAGGTGVYLSLCSISGIAGVTFACITALMTLFGVADLANQFGYSPGRLFIRHLEHIQKVMGTFNHEVGDPGYLQPFLGYRIGKLPRQHSILFTLVMKFQTYTREHGEATHLNHDSRLRG